MRTISILLAGLVGCESDVECADVAAVDCADTEGCAAISGRAAVDDGKGGDCVDYTVAREPLGCMSVDMGCASAETTAEAPDGSLYLFSSTCVPDGFNSVGVGTLTECP